MGPNRWDKRNITQLLPDWKPGDAIPNTVVVRRALGSRRSSYKDAAKVLLQKHLGDQLPVWFDKAGSRGLFKLKENFKDVPVVQEIIDDLQKKTEALNAVAGKYTARYTRELEYGQIQIAHDVCRHLQQKGVTRLIVEASFVAKASQKQDNEDPASLKNSQKYRQFAAVSKFVSLLKNIAVKYGIAVEVLSAQNTTRICQYCNHLNPSTEKEIFFCEGCGKQVQQDQNAAVNLSRFGIDPELAEMALTFSKD
jgi:transposase